MGENSYLKPSLCYVGAQGDRAKGYSVCGVPFGMYPSTTFSKQTFGHGYLDKVNFCLRIIRINRARKNKNN